MQKIEIQAVKREVLGKTATRELRKNEEVPCVLYGGQEVVHFVSTENEFRKLLLTPNVYLITINVGGTKYDGIIKDLQFHPVTDKVMHADFLHVAADKPLTIEIPVVLEGLAEGVKAGGKLQLEQRKLRVRGLSKDIPDALVVNINNLGLGRGIQVGDLSYPNMELLNAKNSVVVSVKLTRAARAAATTKG
jgi:large subunit ribosomal protein L25